MNPAPPVTRMRSLCFFILLTMFAPHVYGRFVKALKGSDVKPRLRKFNTTQAAFGEIPIVDVGYLILAAGGRRLADELLEDAIVVYIGADDSEVAFGLFRLLNDLKNIPALVDDCDAVPVRVGNFFQEYRSSIGEILN